MVQGSTSIGRCSMALSWRAAESAYFSITWMNTPPTTAPGSEAMPPTTAPTRIAIDNANWKLSGEANSMMIVNRAPATPV